MSEHSVDGKGFTPLKLLVPAAGVILATIGISIYRRLQAGDKAAEAKTDKDSIGLPEEDQDSPQQA
jgi:hypothetical protein